MTRDEFTEAAMSCEQKLFRIAYLSLRSAADCQDAVQETLLRAWRARDSLRQAEYFDTWMVRILLNVMKDFARRAARRPAAELTDISAWADFAPPDPDLYRAIHALDERLRTPLLLHHIAGYSVSETASLCRITRAQVRWRLEKAKTQLRGTLADETEAIQ